MISVLIIKMIRKLIKSFTKVYCRNIETPICKRSNEMNREMEQNMNNND